ncbi:hypothetical protein K505DRAFT_141652 [Melanomma pulvis-pyrius CBS 109.77]|uniref:Uncharacterized protein n=1 Tax=Melanomma pulvis-pyrius CBS 109.77 TaxID=1314802 RepID=A0A6A6XYF4_9PLEO|nr:hypothetical protein K505DRAFT_141652 [Melanomma pulvis-pyrius CBS 109.77]
MFLSFSIPHSTTIICPGLPMSPRRVPDLCPIDSLRAASPRRVEGVRLVDHYEAYTWCSAFVTCSERARDLCCHFFGGFTFFQHEHSEEFLAFFLGGSNTYFFCTLDLDLFYVVETPHLTIYAVNILALDIYDESGHSRSFAYPQKLRRQAMTKANR